MHRNILFLMVDQLHYLDTGFMGHPVVRTPNLDRLRRDSVLGRRFYVQNAFCLPSRTSYLTGQYLHHHRQFGFTGILEETAPSLALHLREHGYQTVHSGKLHVNSFGDRIGFEELYPTLPEDIWQATDPRRTYQAYACEQGIGYPTDQIHGDEYRKAPIAEPAGAGHSGTSNVPDALSVEAWTADQAIDFLRQPHERPFFLHVSFDRPHGPWSPSPEYADLYDPDDIPLPDPLTPEQLAGMPDHIRRIIDDSVLSVRRCGQAGLRQQIAHYLGLVTQIDHAIGRVLDALREAGLYDDALIVFCADHGDMGGEKGLFDKYSNQIFHDAIIRSPLLLKLPGNEAAGTARDELIESIDLFPTICEAAGVACGDLPLDGRSLLPLVTGAAPAWPDQAFSESYTLKTLIRGDWKLIYYVNHDEGELYNLREDPGERRNRYRDPACAALLIELKTAIVKLLTTPVSPSRQAYLRTLFDDSATQSAEALDKLFKWEKGIVEGGGFWMLFRDGCRLVYLPFDDDLRLEQPDPARPTNGYHMDYVPVDDPLRLQAMVDELLDYICGKIRPISLMTGGVEGQDNVNRMRGFGFC